MVIFSGWSRGVSSSHSTGNDTGAPSLARVENAEIDVFVRLFRK